MTAIFGIEESNAQGFIDKGIVCYPSPDGKLDLHSVVSAIRNEDIVFIKHCTPQLRLHVKAVGIVLSDYPTNSDLGTCLPVEWVWQGEKILENFGEILSLCGDALYEEHNLQVQREIINLLPQKYQSPQEW
ncbi:MAG: hypothetical protein A3J49_14645 [Gallionellales bacterium RIFCSPHIGHO2_02_FULL_57_16]|nr:MAG: hypothetical protein A3J49_14645 [Gallionellales bacterium RIFCSPHIGHO2_02_FULL_57_16]